MGCPPPTNNRSNSHLRTMRSAILSHWYETHVEIYLSTLNPLTIASQNTYNQYFPGFDASVRLDGSSSFVPPPHSPPDSFTKTSVSSNDPHTNTKLDPSSIDGDENQYADPTLGRSSSEEKELMTPAQTKRKAQNRAAYVISLAIYSYMIHLHLQLHLPSMVWWFFGLYMLTISNI